MKSKTLPSDIAEVRQQFESYRNNSTTKRTLPTELWDLAIGLCEKHKVSPVAAALRLHAGTLSNKIRASKMGKKSRPSTKTTSTAVVELAPLQLSDSSAKASRSSLVAELCTSSGTMLRIFSGAGPDQVKALLAMAEAQS